MSPGLSTGQVGAPQFPTRAVGATGAGPVPHHAPASPLLQHLFLITASFQSVRENISPPGSPLATKCYYFSVGVDARHLPSSATCRQVPRVGMEPVAPRGVGKVNWSN